MTLSQNYKTMTANSKTPTLNDWLAIATTKLARAGIVSARLDAELLVSFVLSKERIWLHAHPEFLLSGAVQKKLNPLLNKRARHEPLAYILGSKEFYGRDFITTTDVLVPRPESEDFIEFIKEFDESGLQFIDIGTGSGILAISTALEKPSWSGVATDIGKETLKVAQKNANKLKPKNLVFKVQNLLANDTEKYDLVIANLPYVPNSLRGKPDISHEPEIALFAGTDDLDLYKELFTQVADRQHKPMHILTESLLTQHMRLKNIARAAGYKLEDTKGLIQHFRLR